VFSSWDPYLPHVTSALDRLVGHLAPAALLAVGYLLADAASTRPYRARASPATAPVTPVTARGAPPHHNQVNSYHDRSTGPPATGSPRAPRTAPGPPTPRPAA
jgi:hypothetical protein